MIALTATHKLTNSIHRFVAGKDEQLLKLSEGVEIFTGEMLVTLKIAASTSGEAPGQSCQRV